MIRGELKKKCARAQEQCRIAHNAKNGDDDGSKQHGGAQIHDYARNKTRGRRDEIAAQEWGRKKKYMYKRCTKMKTENTNRRFRFVSCGHLTMAKCKEAGRSKGTRAISAQFVAAFATKAIVPRNLFV